MGDRLEVSILVTNYLKKIGVREIIAKAETNDHGEILELVGATRIVFPNKEAAKRIVPLLISSLVFSYLPISNEFVIAEIKVPSPLVGKSLIQVDFRRKHNINVIAFRKLDVENYALFSPEYRLKEDDILLVGGSEQDIGAFGEVDVLKGTPRLTAIFKRLFSRKE
jgi:trk system potassium uptake protein TrkA